jgi:hypothetical protein
MSREPHTRPSTGVTMRQALSDPELLGTVLEGPSWRTWVVVLVAIMGEALFAEERAIFKEITGRDREPGERVHEFWGIIGRRGGKSRAIAVLIIFIAVLVDHSRVIVSGERPVVLCLAPTARQAGIVLGYIAGILESVPLFAGMIVNKTAESIELSNGIFVEIRAATFRGVRGFTTVAVVGDEIAFWRSDESANPDKEILQALRPSLGTTGGMLFAISSPHAQRGALYDAYRKDFGPNGDPLTLVVKAPTRTMNPSLPERVVDKAYEDDPLSAAAEYGAEFRNDLEVFVSREIIESCRTRNLLVRAPLSGGVYRAFCDPSGGSSDSMTMAIAHSEGDRLVLDCIGERKAPFAPDSVVQEFAALLQSYGVQTVTGDRYAGEWPRERFQVHGIRYLPAEMNRSELYLNFLPLVNSGRVDLLDNERMVLQFCALERRTARSGKDSVDHPPGGHDDIANAVAGVFSLLSQPAHVAPTPQFGTFSGPFGSGGEWSVGNPAAIHYSSRPAWWWVQQTGRCHPNDKQYWIDQGVLPPDEKESVK